MMKTLTLSLLFLGSFSPVFADIVKSAPTGYPVLDYTLVIGVFAVIILLIVSRVRKRRHM